MAELRHYRYFVEIARRGTFTAAAEALNMTQSALSEQILQLERECGSQLFNRRHSGITLTPAGEYLLHQAEVLLAKAAETREGLAGFRHGYQARLRIASVLGPIQSWLPAALADFVQVHPHVQLQVNHHHGVNEILAKLAGDQLDIGIVSLMPSSPARSRHQDLSQTVLLDEDLVVLAPAGHSLAQLAHVRQEDLLDAHLITFPADYNVRRITDEWFRRGGSAPIVAAETGAVEVMLELISAGLGVAIMPRSLASRGLASGMRALRMTPDDPPRRVVAAVHRRNGRNADLVGAMMRALEAHARGSSRSAAPAEASALGRGLGSST
ncbi:MAG TPA: LysR family transcriptional regulator [Candidatus Dormibacteraeota bacterium]|nr:LysR family transcriptional regulator [Candidatus Dormibacteraeota bacterium]